MATAQSFGHAGCRIRYGYYDSTLEGSTHVPTDEQTSMPSSTKAELARLMETFRKTCPNPTRRDLMRWSAIAGAAAATATFGAGSVAAAPVSTTRALSRFQDNVVTDAKI